MKTNLSNIISNKSMFVSFFIYWSTVLRTEDVSLRSGPRVVTEDRKIYTYTCMVPCRNGR